MVRKGPEELKMEAGYPFAPPPAILLDVCGWIAGAGAGGVCGCVRCHSIKVLTSPLI